MSSTLAESKCEPCEGGVEPLTLPEAQRYLDEINDQWRLAADGKTIYRNFAFAGFNRTMGFVNAVAWIANNEGHHPELAVGYGRCEVTFTTHAIDGLSVNDFICAAKIDQLLDD